jgi:hypothetical protein
MHRQHAFLRHQEVHDGENALFDLAGILGAGDQDALLSKSNTMAASELTPSTSGTHLNPGAARTVNPETKDFSCSAVGRIKALFTNTAPNWPAR